MLSDLTEQQDLAIQGQVLSQQDFAQKMHCRQLATHAFIGSHAHGAEQCVAAIGLLGDLMW